MTTGHVPEQYASATEINTVLLTKAMPPSPGLLLNENRSGTCDHRDVLKILVTGLDGRLHCTQEQGKGRRAQLAILKEFHRIAAEVSRPRG